jgi:hypothetical protein
MQRRKSLLVMMCLVSAVMGCAPITVGENSSVLPTQTKELLIEEVAPTPTVVLRDTPISATPSVLFEGSITFQTELGSASNINAVFDFDANKAFVPDEQSENDIKFGVSHGTNTFVTVTPINGAIGYPFEKSTIDTFAFSDCNISVSKFKSGGRPIHPNQFFCLKTNKGHLVEFAINDIYKTDNVFYIEIRYMVWTGSK